MIAADGKDYARLLLEETLSNEALDHLETALMAYLQEQVNDDDKPWHVELSNLRNLIVSHFQHLVAERKAAPEIDPLLT